MAWWPASIQNGLMNKDFKVPKIPKELEILREGASGFHPCRVFLSSLSRHHRGPETVTEFLNDGMAFVPVELDGKISVLNLYNVIAFRDISRQVEGFGKPFQLTLEKARLFVVQSGERLPESRGRTQDYLNTEGTFLEFVFENAQFYVNKRYIISAVDQ